MTTAVRVFDKCAEENPELTYGLIKDILIGLEELEQGECSKYEFN